jgi:hypothetical protein
MLRRALILALAATAATGPALAGEKGEGKDAPPPSYIPIQTLTAYTNKPGGRRGVMTVDCGLDVPSRALHDRVMVVLPRLRAAYVETLQIYAGGLPAGYPPNPEFLARSLQRRTDEMLGANGAQVLMGSVMLN